MNGSVDILADAMRKVFQEGVESAVAPVEKAVTGLRNDMKNMEKRLDQKIDTTNQDMQTQFAEQERKIAQLIKGAD